MRVPKLDIYEGLPDKTNIRTAEIANIFGYKNQTDVLTHVKKGRIPKPSSRRDSINRDESFGRHKEYLFRTKNYHYWKLGDLRKLKIELESK